MLTPIIGAVMPTELRGIIYTPSPMAPSMSTLTYRTKKSGIIIGITHWGSKTFLSGNTWSLGGPRRTRPSGVTIGSEVTAWLLRRTTIVDNKSKGIQGSVKLNNETGIQVEVANDLYFVICVASKPKQADFFKKKGGGAK